MSQTNSRVGLLSYIEVKHSDRPLQVIWLVLTNQSVLFQQSEFI